MCKNNTCLISIAISIVIAMAVAVGFFTGALTGITSFLIISLILAAIATLSMILAKGYKDNWCLCENAICLVTGIAGTLFFGTISLAITLTAETIISVLIIALVGFFTGLTLTNLIALLICVSKAGCIRKDC